jgi:hypothetical protein
MMDYTDRVVFSFIGSKVLEKMKLVQEALIRLIYELSKTTWKQLPKVLTDEIEGILDGCRKSNPKTRVDLEHLIVLNTGIDIICSMVYSGNFLKRDLFEIEPEDFRIPLMCNAFTVCGKSAGMVIISGGTLRSHPPTYSRIRLRRSSTTPRARRQAAAGALPYRS